MRRRSSGLRARYRGFTARPFHEHLVRDQPYRWGSTWTKLFLQSKGLLERRDAHPRERPRRPLPGMMPHRDGSRHEWLAGQPAMGLIVTMDDAPNEFYSAFLAEEEGTASTFRALMEVFGERGLPLAFCRPRQSLLSDACFAVKAEREGSAFVAIAASIWPRSRAPSRNARSATTIP